METSESHELLAKLRERVGSKADYIPVTLDDAREDFIRRAQETAASLRAGEVRPYHPAPMARQQKRTRMFCLKIGYGENNAYLPNVVHTPSQFIKYDNAEGAAHDIESIIIPLAKAGGFDESLSKVLERHKAASGRRIAKAEQNKAASASAAPAVREAAE